MVSINQLYKNNEANMKGPLTLSTRFPTSSPLTSISVDPMSASSRQTAVGEAVELAMYHFDAFKTKSKEDPPEPEVTLMAASETEVDAFNKRRILGEL